MKAVPEVYWFWYLVMKDFEKSFGKITFSSGAPSLSYPLLVFILSLLGGRGLWQLRSEVLVWDSV